MDEREDPIDVTSVEFDDEVIAIQWLDKRDQSNDSTVVRTTYMRADKVADNEVMAYSLNEIRESTLALLAQWKAWQQQAN